MTEVVLYGRPDCHLCDEARDAIRAMRGAGRSFELREINIEDDEVLHAEYLERIPVVSVDDAIVSELELDSAALERRLDTVPG